MLICFSVFLDKHTNVSTCLVWGKYIRLRECKFVSRRRRTQTRYGSRFRCLLQHIKNCKTPSPVCKHTVWAFYHFSLCLASKANERLHVGHKTKRYIFASKTGVVKAKGIFYVSFFGEINLFSIKPFARRPKSNTKSSDMNFVIKNFSP